MILPILHIWSEGAPGLIFVNGRMIGQSSNRPVIPVSPDGLSYVTYLPLGSPEAVIPLPLTVLLRFENGKLTGPADGCTMMMHADGRIDVQMHPALLPLYSEPSSPYSIGQVHFQHRDQSHTATAYFDNGIHIAVENRRRDRAELLYSPADMNQAQLTLGTGFSGTDVILAGDGPKGPRFVVISPQSHGFVVMADEYADGQLECERAVCIRPLGDTCGHQQRYILSLQNGRIVKEQEQYGFFTGVRRTPNTPELVCKAFCEAVRLGLFDEAVSLLTPALAGGLETEDLNGFFGEFAHVHAVQPGRQIEVTLALPVFTGCYRLVRYSFEMQGLFIANILQD